METYELKVTQLTEDLRKSQIHEKIAMLYGYADTIHLGHRPPNLLKRIGEDIDAMREIKSSIKEEENVIRDGGDAMFVEMIGKFPEGEIASLGDKFNDLFR